MKKKLLAALLLLTGSVNTSAAGLDLALSDDIANLSLLLNPFTSYAWGQGYTGQCRQGGPSLTCDGGTEMAIGGMITEAGDNIAHASLMARSARVTDTAMYDLAAGMKLIGGEVDYTERLENPNVRDETVGALALGLQFGTLLIRSPTNPVDASVSVFYAPGITSFSDADRYLEYSGRLQIEIIPSARAYIGYRHLSFETEGYNDVDLDSSTHVGLKISF